MKNAKILIVVSILAMGSVSTSVASDSRSETHKHPTDAPRRSPQEINGNECVICSDSIDTKEATSILPCQHNTKFHKKCLAAWLQTAGAQRSCPICRNPAKQSILNQLIHNNNWKRLIQNIIPHHMRQAILIGSIGAFYYLLISLYLETIDPAATPFSIDSTTAPFSLENNQCTDQDFIQMLVWKEMNRLY